MKKLPSGLTFPSGVALTARKYMQVYGCTEEDLAHAKTNRHAFLERLCHKHGLGLDEAERQLKAFEDKNPELYFERS